ncbi:4Fe-4S dicluster domain-containing protein [Candidatus Bipolaricaulota bacterium]
MKRGKIDKTDLGKLLAAVSETARCAGPVTDRVGVKLEALSAGSTLELGYDNFELSPKLWFFPRSEVIACGNGGALETTPLPEETTVLFGLRPCDAASLELLDKIFLDEAYLDPYYKSRREGTTIIALACKEPGSACFCTSVGGGPGASAGADVIAFDLGEALLLEAVTDKGEALLTKHEKLLSAAVAGDDAAKEKVIAGAEAKLQPIKTDGLAAKLAELFDAPIWEAIGERCVGCGTCTYLCPTCHCFGITDEKSDTAVQRIRVQDACMFPRFTLEASGHNPRGTQGARARQRVMHKFSYTVDNLGETFCVGCGRCVVHCPVNIDIREILEEVGA